MNEDEKIDWVNIGRLIAGQLQKHLETITPIFKAASRIIALKEFFKVSPKKGEILVNTIQRILIKVRYCFSNLRLYYN
ncbi:MAG: hypothetical protein QW511_00320 [Candidatus Methanomethylicia archaeon]